MNKFALGFLVLAIHSMTEDRSAETNAQPHKRDIPLKDIWAYQMPGTRDIRDLEPDKFGSEI
jgi:hypothetical protein